MSHVILTSNPLVFFVALVVLLYLIKPKWMNDLLSGEKMDIIAPPLIGISFPIVFVVLVTLLTLEPQTMDVTQSDVVQSSVSAVVGQSGH